MTNFISASTPLQPAFIYAAWPTGTSVQASPANAVTVPASVLQAHEAIGFSFDSITIGNSLVFNFLNQAQMSAFAIAGVGLSGASVALFGSSDNFVTSNVQLLPATPFSNDAFFWAQFAPSAYQYLKLVFTGLSSAHAIRHVAITNLVLLPFLEDGTFCPDPIEVTGDHLISYTGLFLGSVTQKVMRPFDLSFGQIDSVEEAAFSAWAMACLAVAQGFFFIPDTNRPEVYFGSVDKNYKYNPIMSIGFAKIPPIPFSARVT